MGEEWLVNVSGAGRFLKVEKAMDLTAFQKNNEFVDVTPQAKELIEKDEVGYLVMPMTMQTARQINNNFTDIIEFTDEKRDEYIVHGKRHGSASLLMHIMEDRKCDYEEAIKIQKVIDRHMSDELWEEGV